MKKRIIAITGGKGGTGKSTVATSLAYALSNEHKVLLVDADVDCPNDHLILKLERNLLKVIEQRIPKFDFDKCLKCGACGKVCKTKAIVSISNNNPIFIENQCNGCGACKIVCPSNAIDWGNKDIGKIYSGNKDNISFLSGELKANQPISEFIVNHLNEEIEKVQDNYDFIIVDTAAGTHCPVIAALENAHEVIAVTEPTPLGAHDLEIILRLLSDMSKHGKIIINRSDMGDKNQIIELSKKYSTEIIFEIPYFEDIIKAYSNGSPIIINNLLNAIKDDQK
jgi:MinD superfamily P-loop ATPase